MRERYFIRHPESTSNLGDLSFDDEAPVTEKGIIQAAERKAALKKEFGIVPEEYKGRVIASELARAKAMAELLGFPIYDVSPLLNESPIYKTIDLGEHKTVLDKHVAEHWIPPEELEAGQKFLDAIRSGELDYDIFIGHGMHFAAAIHRLNEEGGSYPFLEDRGFILPQAGIIRVII